MAASHSELLELQQIIAEDYSVELDLVEVEKLGVRLVSFAKAIYQNHDTNKNETQWIQSQPQK